MHFVPGTRITIFYVYLSQAGNRTKQINYALIAIGEQIYRQGIITTGGQWPQACFQAAIRSIQIKAVLFCSPNDPFAR